MIRELYKFVAFATFHDTHDAMIGPKASARFLFFFCRHGIALLNITDWTSYYEIPIAAIAATRIAISFGGR